MFCITGYYKFHAYIYVFLHLLILKLISQIYFTLKYLCSFEEVQIVLTAFIVNITFLKYSAGCHLLIFDSLEYINFYFFV